VAESWLPGGLSPFRTGFLKVALFLGGVWTDVPMTELHESGVQIKRGRGDEGSRTDPGRLSFSLKDPTGKYSPRNPSSPLYGQVGRGTKVRVQVELVAGVVLDRFYGEVVSWRPRWTKKGAPSARVYVAAAGLLVRIGQPGAPARSALFRHETTRVSSLVQAYWPMEDGRAATMAVQRGSGGAVDVQGNPTLANYSDLPSSGALPTLGNARLTAAPTPYFDTVLGTWSTVRFVVRVPAGTASGVTVASIVGAGTATGGAGNTLNLLYSTASGGSLTMGGLTIITGVDDRPCWVYVAGRNVAGAPVNLEWTASAMRFGNTALSTVGATITTATFGGVGSVVFNPNAAALGATAVGHVMIQRGTIGSTPDVLLPFNANAGEQAHVRVQRLCTEAGLTSTVIGTASELMGNQPVADLLTLLRQCEATDGGFLYEPLSTTNLEYRTLESLYSQTPTTVPYVENQLLPFEPVEDESVIQNRVTVTRAGGASATVTQAAGPLGTATVGVYDDEVTLSLASDADALGQAAWRVALGTTDEARWPQIGVDLADPRITSGRRSAFLALRLGDRLDVTGLPAWLPPFDVSQLVQGYTETIEPGSYKIVFNTAPARPYRVAFWTNAAGRDRYSGDGTVLSAAIATTTATTFNVTPPSTCTWTTTDLPFAIVVNGEVMTVTAVGALTGGQQTFTVTRSVNGVRKTHAINSAVTLADPCYWSL
jgi:hypothetical protein